MGTHLVLLFLVFTITPLTLIDPSTSINLHESQEYFEVTPPLPSDRLSPSCCVPIIQHQYSFNSESTTTSSLVSTAYSPPPDCPSPWAYVVLELLARCSNNTSYGIIGLWLGGIELLRSSTTELIGTNKSRNMWKVRKDITKYSSILKQTDLLFSVSLKNVVDGVPSGEYNVSVTLLFFTDGGSLSLPMLSIYPGMDSAVGSYDKPADLIIPICYSNGNSSNGDDGYWFRIENELHFPSKQIVVPRNTHRAVLELYVSFHGSDESWYSNPSSSYLRMNNIDSLQGNGAFREVFVTIDGACVGSVLPFPVMYTGGINPLFWKPIVAIGAFDLPTYDFVITPFLEKVLDGKVHEIGVGVGHGISYWLVDANLHLWLDTESSSVKAGTVIAYNPTLSFRSHEEFKRLDGSFQIQGKGKSETMGWVISSAGKLTTVNTQQFKVHSLIQYQKNGTYRVVKFKVKVDREVKVLNGRGLLINQITVRRKYPLTIITSALAAGRLVANVSHAFDEIISFGKLITRAVSNSQQSNGWMQVGDASSLAGDARTDQKLSYKDESMCFSRNVAVTNGVLSTDEMSYGCSSVS